MFNNSIVYNSSSNGGGAWITGAAQIINCIIWGNVPQQITGGVPLIYYSDIQGGYPGAGNIDADPLFVTGPEGDYYLSQLAAGQAQQSPCVDAGDPAAIMVEGTTRTDGIPDQEVVDMGYHYLSFAGFQPPTNFALLQPGNLSIMDDPRPLFDWEDSFDPDGGTITYELQYDTTANFLTPVMIIPLPGSSWQPDYDLPPDQYWWVVFAHDNEGQWTQSNQVWSFTILPPPPITITLTPWDPPIQIPAIGGNFDYNIEGSNATTSFVNCDVWCDVTLPDGSPYGPVMGPTNVNIPGSMSLNRDRTQAVPANAPAGLYSFNAYIGDYPDSVWDSDSFPFTKVGSGIQDSGFGKNAGDWSNTGRAFQLENAAPFILYPSSFSLTVSPNPFNPATTFAFTLSAPAQVRLEVFDVRGREVSRVGFGESDLQGWYSAGTHEVTFDGSDLPSGVYLYRLQAGELSAAGKMVLLR